MKLNMPVTWLRQQSQAVGDRSPLEIWALKFQQMFVIPPGRLYRKVACTRICRMESLDEDSAFVPWEARDAQLVCVK